MFGSLTSSALLLVARAFLAAVFLHDGVVKISEPIRAVAFMTAFGVPAWMLWPAILVEVGGALFVATGLLTRIGCAALAAFCVVTAVVFHARWTESGQLIQFEKNLAIAGGLIALYVVGAGQFAVDRLIRRR
jgi:putative oxidoreductase